MLASCCLYSSATASVCAASSSFAKDERGAMNEECIILAVDRRANAVDRRAYVANRPEVAQGQRGPKS